MKDDQATPVLELRGLRLALRPDALRPAQHVLRGISARFLRGQCTGVLGHNGAGKTSTIRVILGLARPDSGDVWFNGKPITKAARRNFGYMPEVNKLAGGLTPIEALSFQLKMMRPPGSETSAGRTLLIEKKLAEVGLSGHGKQKIRRLSKGMARRLAWAQATIHQPQLLILDEPFSGLDPLGRKHMYDWIARERDRDCSILLCTHELRQVHTICDHFHVFNSGRVVLSTNPELDSSTPAPTAPAWHHSYNLHISGVDEDQLREMFKKSKLPPWQGYRQDGYLAVMGFEVYEHAAKWFTAMSQQGIVIVRFGDQAFYGEEELMPFFESQGV